MGSVQDRSHRSARTGKWVKRYLARPTAGGIALPTRSFGTLRDAQAYNVMMEARFQTGEIFDGRRGRQPFADVSAAWMERKVGAEGTLARYEIALRVHILPVLGHRPIAGIRPSHVEALIAALVGKGLHRSTISTTIGVLRAVLQSAVRDGVIASNVCDRVVLQRAERARREALTPTEVQRIAAQLDPVFRLAVLLSASTGLRQGECFGLTMGDVDFDLGLIRIERQLISPDRGSPRRDALKTPSSKRSVPLPAFLATDLRERTEALKAAGRGSDDLLFTTSAGMPIRRSRVAEKVRTAALKAGIGRRVTSHDLRRSFSSVLIASGRDVVEVSVALGHSSVSETLKSYAHPLAGTEAARLRSIDRVLSEEYGDLHVE